MACREVAGLCAATHPKAAGPHPPPKPRSELRAIGWAVAKVVMVPDEVSAIAKEVALLAA